ncbi:TPA: hypothetical protein HA235_06560 [Candidatus Woesearchaeota archaeon]|nr:hypothetical protein [Candidatus Woesearchaeota archaeon]HAB53880.1 hypothetical protein [Ignavibacteriales bacterium]HIH32338.1 hypothetical protein [Candidatus Woesearchaeota archaeon]HIH55164.1 hypothetical protein [Candidatus Woesearchaeota archaeon]HIJ13376.1 hypothetical protein [Candidatus Woesearchaeota archaeon]
MINIYLLLLAVSCQIGYVIGFFLNKIAKEELKEINPYVRIFHVIIISIMIIVFSLSVPSPYSYFIIAFSIILGLLIIKFPIKFNISFSIFSPILAALMFIFSKNILEIASLMVLEQILLIALFYNKKIMKFIAIRSLIFLITAIIFLFMGV